MLRLNERQNLSKEKSKARYDFRVKPIKLKPGDYVYVKKEIRTHKFEKFYDKPLKVVTVTNTNNVILELPDRTKIVKHLNKVKPAYNYDTNQTQFSE